MHSRRYSGFSLLELSLVLVIISLLIGSVMIGQTLIRNAQLRSAVNELAQHTQNIAAFKEKYMALPGDFNGADTLWGGTCNGDGNGRITNQAGGAHAEQFCAWWMLSKAGFMQENFSATAGSLGSMDRTPGVNVPSSRLSGAGWGLITLKIADINGGVTDLPYSTGDIPPNTVLWLGGKSINGTNNLQTPLMNPEEALLTDQKIDDGLPTVGKAVAQNSLICYSSNQYDLTRTDLICAMVFKTGL